MKLDLTRFRRPFEHLDRVIAPDGMPPVADGAYQVVAPVELSVDVHKDKTRYRLDGTVRTELELVCSRCLEPYRLAVDAAFDLRYLPVSEAQEGGDREVTDGDVDTNYYRDDEISLADLLQEQFYLAMPMKPLCRDACRGLCPECGINLNEGSCSCTTTWEDPRLAPLREIGRTGDA